MKRGTFCNVSRQRTVKYPKPTRTEPKPTGLSHRTEGSSGANRIAPELWCTKYTNYFGCMTFKRRIHYSIANRSPLRTVTGRPVNTAVQTKENPGDLHELGLFLSECKLRDFKCQLVCLRRMKDMGTKICQESKDLDFDRHTGVRSISWKIKDLKRTKKFVVIRFFKRFQMQGSCKWSGKARHVHKYDRKTHRRPCCYDSMFVDKIGFSLNVKRKMFFKKWAQETDVSDHFSWNCC